MRLPTLTIYLLAIMLTASTYAQKNPMRWGKISKEHWQLKTVSYDSLANAVVLCDFGTLNFGYGIPTTITQHRRIKILNQKGLDQADIMLPFYAKDNNEKIAKLKAQTLNLENGKVSKLKVNDFYEVDINEDWKSKNFSFSGVKEGSIIEYSYTKYIENNFSFEDWEFQSDLPTLHSEYQATISKGLDVRIFFNSNRLFQKYGNKTTNRWHLKNLPAHKPEVFCPNPQDYIEKISFQLAGYYKRGAMGGSEYVNIMTNWDELASELYQYHQIYSYLNKKGKCKEMLSTLIHSSFSADEKVHAIYDFVTKNFEFNGETRRYTEQNFNEFLETRRGNSAEINLLLVALLREADLEADPALISTKKHGVMREGYPMLNQFNKSVASLKLNGKTIILDATNPYLPHDLLPKEDLNDKALVYNRSTAKWVKIEEPKKSQQLIYVLADLSKDTASYSINIIASGYHAAEARKKLAGNLDQNEIIKDLFAADAEENIDSLKIENLDNKKEKLIVKIYFSNPDNPLLNDRDLIYYEPLGIKKLIDNPFTQADRELPVDLYYNKFLSFQYTVILPSAMVVDEVPKSVKFVMPNKNADFIYQVQSTGQNLQMVIRLNHHDHFYHVSEYSNLRKMYTLITDKLSQPMVINKKKI